MQWQCKQAPSIGGGHAGTPETAWGTLPYTDVNAPTVFFGLYSLNDFNVLRNHKGQKAVLFAGSDITHLKNGYWLDDEGKIKVDPVAFCDYLATLDCYCENNKEKDVLWAMGIKCKAVIPSFLGNVDDYPVQELRTDKKRFYTSVSGDDFELYGWQFIDELARDNPNDEYHLYGNTKPWTSTQKNVIIHGRIPQEEMNEQIKTMTGGLRLTRFDGFSEILAKSYLWGQKPLSPFIPYTYKDRDDLLKVLNTFPWVSN